MSKLDIIITMGGVGKRFRDLGYDCPKYMINAKDRTLFEWSMYSLEGYRNAVDKYIFIAKKDTDHDVMKFISDKCDEMNIKNRKIMVIDYLTDGQATTAMLAKEYVNNNNGFLVYNIDTYVEPHELKYEDIKGDGFIPCFNAEGDHWSFVKVGMNGKAECVKEKFRISDNCSIGLYYFRNFSLFQDAYKNYYDEHKSEIGEKYIAPLYNYLIETGKDVYIKHLSDSSVHVLGTPEEMNKFINE